MGSIESKKKIIYVITGTGVGGAEKMLYHTIKGLDPACYSVRLCSLKKKGVYANMLETEGVNVYSLDMKDEDTLSGWFDSLRVLMLLALYFLKEKPVIVHSFLFRANIIARIAAFLTGVPVVICSVRVMGGEKPYSRFIERATAFMADHYVAVSEQVKAHVHRSTGIAERKISTIYNGIAVAKGDIRDHGELRSRNGLNADDRLVMTAGRLHRQKGFDCLIQAMAVVHTACPRVKLLILGEGEEENNLKKLARSLELTDRIQFLGLRPDVDRLLHCIDLFVLPSRWEGLPNAVLEAMAAGKPVVATEVGGIPELVVRGVTGMIVPPQDVHALAEAIKALLSDEPRALSMGAAGRERVQRHFSIDAMIAKTEALYQELLQQKQPA